MLERSVSEAVEDLLFRVNRVVGLMTTPLRTLPHFLIIGTQKGGTTSLYRFLLQHPDVAGSMRKEVHYFDLNYEKGTSWYRSFFPLSASAELHKRRAGRRLIVGEATPSYLYHPDVPERVKAVLPEALLIVLLRDPVARAFSHYEHMRVRGQERLPFPEAVEIERERLADTSTSRSTDRDSENETDLRFSYIARGFYAAQLRRWLTRFDESQFLILKSEALFQSPADAVNEACRFLGLVPWKPPEFRAYNRSNYKVPMNSGTRRILANIYAPYNEELEALTGRSFDWNQTTS